MVLKCMKYIGKNWYGPEIIGLYINNCKYLISNVILNLEF